MLNVVADASAGVGSAAADPAFWLPFTICCARNPWLEVVLLVQWGLLPLALRCLASPDSLLRCVVMAFKGLRSYCRRCFVMARDGQMQWRESALSGAVGTLLSQALRCLACSDALWRCLVVAGLDAFCAHFWGLLVSCIGACSCLAA